MTVGKLLALALAVEKQYTKAITEDKGVQFPVNTLKSSFVDAWNSNSWYFISSLKAKVGLENGFEFTILLDTGTKMNVMTRKIIEDADLAIRCAPKLELVSYTNYSRLFLDLYEV